MRALGNNTALVFIHAFGSHSSVTVVNASTNKGICLIESMGYSDSHGQHRYRVSSKNETADVTESYLKTYVTGLTHFPRNCTKRNRNYSHAVLKGA
jgi:hypothetical protein